jgi:hypothetical protein
LGLVGGGGGGGGGGAAPPPIIGAASENFAFYPTIDTNASFLSL